MVYMVKFNLLSCTTVIHRMPRGKIGLLVGFKKLPLIKNESFVSFIRVSTVFRTRKIRVAVCFSCRARACVRAL